MIDIGYLLGCLSEYLIFVYFANTNLTPRKNCLQSTIIALLGYIIIWMAGLLNSILISILVFFVTNVILLRIAYIISLKMAIFYGMLLDSFSTLSEFALSYWHGVRFHFSRDDYTTQQVFTILTGSKLSYLMEVIILKYFSKRKMFPYTEINLGLIVIPLLTIICVTILIAVEMNYRLFFILCSALLVINIITFYIHTRMSEKNQQLKLLQQEREKNIAELGEYRLLAEKYENTKIMRHDFRKQLAVLSDLITEDNEKAKKYMRGLQFSQRELDYVRYTDNNILNVILAQKVRECHDAGIEIHIHSASPTLSFISDIDTVTIFSNLIDNAIEASANTETKEIFVDLYTVNGAFSAVKVENNADREPIVLDGMPRTQKDNPNEHGLGIRSINNALKKYNSSLDWSYDKENKFFRALVLLHIPKNKISHLDNSGCQTTNVIIK